MGRKHRKGSLKTPGTRQRTAIAREAARILAETRSTDFAMAKRKASERLGQSVSQPGDLPNHQEIEQALLDYQSLFSPQQHQQELQALRKAALAAMKLLKTFEPRLAGPVLSGSANLDSPVELHLFADRAEDVYMALMARDIPAADGEKRLNVRGANGGIRLESFPCYSFVAGDIALQLVVLPLARQRQAPVNPADGKAIPQADLSALEALLEAAS